MRNLSIVKKASNANSSEIEDFEKEYKTQLPSQFKDFFLQVNPIDVEERLIKKGDREFYVDRFFPFDKNHELSFQSTNENLRDFFENKYLTFGCDSGGWQFVISVQEQDYGQVYFCRMDEALEDALIPLADDFESFINGLQKSQEE